jgi:hypothetical protein
MVCSFLLGVEMQAPHADAKNPARLSRPGACLDNAYLYQKSVTVASGFGEGLVCSSSDEEDRHSTRGVKLSKEMEMKRFLAMAALMIGILAAATTVKAQSPYPSRSIKMICGFPAGSSLDVITRIYAEKLEKTLGQSVVVENRVGASGNLAAEAVARSAPDGYTLLTNGVTLPISMSLFKKISFDVVKDFTPIGFMGNIPIILAANAALGVNSVAQATTRSSRGAMIHSL